MGKRFYERIHLNTLDSHLRTPNPPIQVILGPRQVGKTTAVQQYLAGWKGPSHYSTADLISPPDAAWLVRQWEEARNRATPSKRGILVLDEIQKIPRWSEAVKKCYDEDHLSGFPLCVVILGSSSLLVQRGLSESLAGRFEIIPFPHWSFKECREHFGISFDEYVFFGGYPGALQILLDSNRGEARWSDYVRNALIETVLNKDILLLTPVTKPALFRQVFSLCCEHAGEVLSYHKMLGQLQEAGNASTVASYVRLLDAAMMIKPLERYSGSRLRQKISSPKLVPLSNALINGSPGKKFVEVRKNSALWGRLVETIVGAALINNNLGKGVDVTYWRDRNQEVDFVLRLGEKIVGVEVKTDAGKGKGGHPQFLKKFPIAAGLTTALKGGDIPVEEFITLSAEKIFSLALR